MIASPAQTTATALELHLQFGNCAYPYYVRSGPGAWDELGVLLARLAPDKFALVVSEGVPEHFVRRMEGCLAAAAGPGSDDGVIVLRVPDGEDTKTLTAVRDMLATVFRKGFTHRSVVVGFGGGKAANMAGLLAGLALRGVRLVQVPTTWLNLWDAAGVSFKQAVNLFDERPAAWWKRLLVRLLRVVRLRRGPDPVVGKNLVGLFKAPVFVFGITDVLDDLPADEIRSAIGEVIKSAVSICPEKIPALRRLLRPGADYTVAELVQLAGIIVPAKQSVMRHDPHEEGDALACEWGHTVGHVIELLWHLPHGLAILIGCLVETRVAIKRGHLDPSVEPLVEDLALRNGAPVTLPPGPSDRAILEALGCDGKRGWLPAIPGYVDLVLLDDLGILHKTDGVPLTQVPEAIVLEALRSSISAKKHARTGVLSRLGGTAEGAGC